MCKLVLQKKRSMRSALLSKTETKRHRRDIMSLDDFILAWFCLIDDTLPSIRAGKRLRSHGPRPKLAVSEVITMEVVGASLLINQHRALYEYFRRHSAHFFPALSQLHRSSFVRQAANLRATTPALARHWQTLADLHRTSEYRRWGHLLSSEGSRHLMAVKTRTSSSSLAASSV